MLGSHEWPNAVGVRSGVRAATLGLALAATGLFAVAGSAQAQNCEGGYHMLRDEIPVCDSGFGQSAVAPATPAQREPLHTGSINGVGAGGGNADELPAAAPSTHINGMKCVGGYAYRGTANESFITMPMPCD